jgi:hypothetical protein
VSKKEVSVQPQWCAGLPLQQQSVLFLAARGPDGIAKVHPCKAVVQAYRGTVLMAARYGRMLRFAEMADSFMTLDRFGHRAFWEEDKRAYFAHQDSLPHHYHLHLMHGAQILGYKHPDNRFRQRWLDFYLEAVHDLHLLPESEQAMDNRLSDWFRVDWDREEER